MGVFSNSLRYAVRRKFRFLWMGRLNLRARTCLHSSYLPCRKSGHASILEGVSYGEAGFWVFRVAVQGGNPVNAIR